MKYCIHCGAPVEDNAKFCTECGGKQELQDQPDNTAYTAQGAAGAAYTGSNSQQYTGGNNAAYTGGNSQQYTGGNNTAYTGGFILQATGNVIFFDIQIRASTSKKPIQNGKTMLPIFDNIIVKSNSNNIGKKTIPK